MVSPTLTRRMVEMLWFIRILIVLIGIGIYVIAALYLPGLILRFVGGASTLVSLGLAGLAGAMVLPLLQFTVTLPLRSIELWQSLFEGPWDKFMRRISDGAKHALVPVLVCVAWQLGGDESQLSAEEMAKISLEQAQKALDLQGYTAPRAERLDLINVGPPNPEGYLASFPVTFEGGKLPQDVELSDIDFRHVEFERGLGFAPDPKETILGLVEALAPCGSPEDRVRLRVEGYASSQPFPDIDRIDSDKLNVRLANERGERVARVVEEALNEHDPDDSRFGGLEIAVYGHLWQMERARRFNDRPAGSMEDETTAPPQDFLTRAAYIKVTHAGSCAVEGP